MAYTLRPQELDAMLRQGDAGKRYAYCLKKIADASALYWLESDQGRCVIGPDDDGRIILPVWPHPRFAEIYAERDAVASVQWKGATPEEIEVHEFLAEFLPELVDGAYEVAAFPLPGGAAAVVEAEEFGEHLEAELERIE